MDNIKRELCLSAIRAMNNSYSPYSGYKVGSALLTDDGEIFTGCNIENASYSPTVCAERVAIFKAVSEGKRHIKMIAVAGGQDGNISTGAAPCGVCRQVMTEFCSEDMPVLIVTSNSGEYKETSLGELLPLAFNLK